jgi:hypothetical protein
VLRGEDLDLVSRELGLTAARLFEWQDQFLAAGHVRLNGRTADERDAEMARLKTLVGDLTMRLELSREAPLWPPGDRRDEPRHVAFLESPV